uniref:Zinc finger protein 687a n=1 Tax=Neogobius melanostomus TaxID=47308 RepID=A0A8C6TUW0_9GOBI
MGDMKTPDFDDLLAAFDIPDIEAIESSPEEEQSEAASPEEKSDAPAVSVIVKNTVGSDKERRVHSDFTAQGNSPESDCHVTDPQLCNIEDLSTVANGPTATDTNQMSNTRPKPQAPSLKHEGKGSDGNRPPQNSQETGDCLKPLVRVQLSTSGTTPPLPRLVSSALPPQSSMGNSTKTTDLPVPSHNFKTKMNNFDQSDEEDSDLEGSLVIQESPEPPEPKSKHTLDVDSDLGESTEETPVPNASQASNSPGFNNHKLNEDVQPDTSGSLAPQLLALPSSGKDEKYPEHVIDERDSPESPPPSETGMMVRQKSPSPEPLRADSECTEQPRGREEGKVCRSGVNVDLNSEVEEKMTHASENIAAGAVTDASSLGPIKVKMKRPAARAATKKGRRAKTEAVRTLSEGDTRPRRKTIKQSKASQITVKGTKLKMPSVSNSSSKPAAKVTPAGITLRNLGQKPASAGVTLPLTSSKLLPPLTSSRPASIVNHTGAIISKNQTNLVEAFNRILNNKNLLPSYKPDLTSSPLAEWGLSLPAQGYRCLECGDSFALEQSLSRHYDRRSLRIEVTCNHCAKRLAFFNKCSLLLHAREHKEKGLIMQCSHLVMKPVPVEQMIGQQEQTVTGLSLILFNLNTSALKKSEEVQYCNNKCPECQTQFSKPEEVAKHFQELITSQTTSCTECSPPMLLSNNCCAAAHLRIHQNSAPHVCPECGGMCTIFLSIAPGLCRCSSCLVVFGSLNSVKSHIQQAHCDVFHKCPVCPMAFKSAPSIQTHISAQHPTMKENQTVVIYKCVMCDTVFTHKSLLYVHFDTHLVNQKVHVFKCPECSRQFSQRSSLMDHLKVRFSNIQYKKLTHFILLKMESSEGEECATSTAKKASCQKSLTYTGHNGNLDDITYSSFSTTSNLRRHIRDKHKPVTRSFRCQYCTDVKKTFNSRAMLEKHIQLRHSLDVGDQDFITVGHQGDEADSSSEQDGSSGFRSRRRAAVKSEHGEETVSGASPVKKWRTPNTPTSETEKGFRCAPCGFTSEDQAAFLEHISVHRKEARGGTQQCLQCGVCFTSNHSLSRHRFIVHKVRDSENQEVPKLCPAPSTDENHEDKNALGGSALESPGGEGALACKVCGKHFEKTTDLNTHFRTHGMAFINARNTGKTA